MLFLVSGTVEQTRYESSTTSIKQTRLVEATDEKEAAEKYREHFRAQSIEYAIYYRAIDCFPTPVIT